VRIRSVIEIFLWEGVRERSEFLLELLREGSSEVVGDCVGWESHGVQRPSMEERCPTRHVPQLVHPLLFAPLVLEPHLDHPHGQPCVLGELLSHHAGGFGCLVEHGFEDFKLLGFDGGAGTSSFAIFAFLFVVFRIGF